MRRLLMLSLALLLLVACTQPAAPGQPEVPASEPEGRPAQPVQVSGPGGGDPPPASTPPGEADMPVPAGECLNLREEPSLQGRVVRCLSAGTRMAIATAADASVSTPWADDLLWLAVSLESGEQGWVAVNTGSVAYAD